VKGVPLCVVCSVGAVRGLVRAWMCPSCGYAFDGVNTQHSAENVNDLVSDPRARRIKTAAR
jgi:hypothetical protein